MGKKNTVDFFQFLTFTSLQQFIHQLWSLSITHTPTSSEAPKKKRIEGVSIASTAENSLLVECLDMAKESSLFYVRKVGIIWPEISTVTKLAIVENISWITMGNRRKDVLASLLSVVYL